MEILRIRRSISARVLRVWIGLTMGFLVLLAQAGSLKATVVNALVYDDAAFETEFQIDLR